MSGNTTRRVPDDRRASRRVPVLFTAILTRKGLRTQMVEVIDLSDTGAKVRVRFELPVGSEAFLKMPGPRRKLEVPSTIANLGESDGHLTAGLRFRVPDDMRAELREIVERVEGHRKREESERPVPGGAAPEVRIPIARNTRVTRRIIGGGSTGKTVRTTRSQHPPPEPPHAGHGHPPQ
ncbi:MAG: PilZ domain-containing protein [Planctomycetes bacterium]|nr:PilZ domain-containing protein [Planctomycetota bacterium]